MFVCDRNILAYVDVKILKTKSSIILVLPVIVIDVVSEGDDEEYEVDKDQMKQK